MKIDLLKTTAVDLQHSLSKEELTSVELVQQCHRQLDMERREGSLRGPLHGIPFIVKDALNTTDEFEVQSTAGGWAFVDSHPFKTANVVELAVKAGLILVGKANLSQFGNWKALKMSGGWSARGGQTQSAYVRGGVADDGIYGHSLCDWSPIFVRQCLIVLEIHLGRLQAQQTTPGTVSEDGGFPFSVDRDSVGPMAECTEDLVNFLNVIADTSHPHVPKDGYWKSSQKQWKIISIATLDPHHWHLPEEVQKPQPGALDQNRVPAITQLRLLAHDSFQANNFSGLLKTYIDGLQTPKVKSLAELIAFNKEHSNLELPPESPGQEKLIQSEEEANRLSKEEYQQLDDKTTAAGREHGIDKVLQEHKVDVVIGPADSRIPDVCALARCPSVTLPLGYLDWNGRPFGLLAVASQIQEELLLDVARSWEAAFPQRQAPSLSDSEL
ncbi:hypothetical protein JMJ35_003241 [Cladonia borealis]|uniref:Amidase domain-containing protein n=1 Tax=Cladonia borealis TaxID=184061 RepID=A0AA39R6L8_9LECA|nr:hypothetical protein JMJ35_003241 [Cladonia borealis]